MVVLTFVVLKTQKLSGLGGGGGGGGGGAPRLGGGRRWGVLRISRAR